ncbi:UxaA family hydrolase [Nitratireductor pacificus]|uniref:UxaA family hydrolase n=1 Tax=Nitratireductor pacificus TaxID=1231180 RepID=UPI0002E844D9|nr:UxaA family hydrolase [Nitratireductor pacificus]
MEKTAIQIKESDHVATATVELLPAETVIVSGIGNGRPMKVEERIPRGHKIALRDIAAQEEILKYGEIIGVATQPISAGHWVHVHNCRGAKGRRFDATPAQQQGE